MCEKKPQENIYNTLHVNNMETERLFGHSLV